MYTHILGGGGSVCSHILRMSVIGTLYVNTYWGGAYYNNVHMYIWYWCIIMFGGGDHIYYVRMYVCLYTSSKRKSLVK